MAGLRFLIAGARGQFDKAFKEASMPIEDAGTKALRQLGDAIKKEGRAEIAAGGLSRKWQNALRVNVYPKSGTSMNAALWAFHKIPYADVFEKGLSIAGRPLLWIPLKSTKKIGRRRPTPSDYASQVGDLVSINRPGLAPLLAGRTSRSKKGELTPLFVGVPSVKMPRLFRLMRIFEKNAGRLAELFNANFKG